MLRVTIRVRPGASRTRVGGTYGSVEAPALVVAVSARPVDGAANEAVVTAVAKAFGLRPRQVTLVAGERSRTKILDLELDADVASARLAELCASP